MSPERIRGQSVDQQTDVWAFGRVLYEALTGRSPFVRATVADTASAILAEEPDWGRLPADIPESLGRLLGGCLEKRPERRPRGPETVSQQLRTGTATPRGGAKRRRLVAGVAVGLGAGAASFAARPFLPRLLLQVAELSGPPAEPPLPDRPSVAVLPFENLSDEPEHDYFRRGDWPERSCASIPGSPWRRPRGYPPE